MVDLRTHIIGNAPAVEVILKQEGIPVLKIRSDENDRENGQVYLAIDTVLSSETELISRCLDMGKVIVCDKKNESFLKKINFKGEKKIGKDIWIGRAGEGHLVYVDRDIAGDFESTLSALKDIDTGYGVIRERVAEHSKSHIRELLSKAILAAYELLDLPLIRIWYFPDGCRSVFNFRFDIDEDTGNDLETIMETSSEYKDCSSWFISCASFDKNRRKIKDLIDRGFDVQSHGYYHHTYAGLKQNAMSVDKSIQYLKDLHCQVEGYVSPKGIWNVSLQKVLEERQFLYSSEFALDYDNFPFFPVVENRVSSVLQIPIHPVCLGLFLESGIEEGEKILKYYSGVIEKKILNNQPALLYGHPNEKYGLRPDLLKAIYHKAGSYDNVWRATMSDIARWWKKRDSLTFEFLRYDTDKKTFAYKIGDNVDCGGINLCVDHSGKRGPYKVQDAEGTKEISDILHEDRNDVTKQTNIFLSEKSSKLTWLKLFKGKAAMFLDWEKCTPVSEIDRTTWTGKIKYCLRKMYK